MAADFGEVLAAAAHAIGGASVDAVRDVCEALLSDSRDQIPYDQGDLSNSGKVTVEETASGAEGAVSFDTPYAARQHEDTSLRHQDGRKAGYLGDPLRQNSPRYLAFLARGMGDAIG